METKVCGNCKISKPLDQFQRRYKKEVVNPYNKPRTSPDCVNCKSCREIRVASWRRRVNNKAK